MVKNSSNAISANNNHSLITSTSSVTAPGQRIISVPDALCEHTCAEWGIESWRKENPTDEGRNCTARRWELWFVQGRCQWESRDKRLAESKDRGGEGDVHLLQARSDQEKDGQIWSAGVSTDPQCASGLRHLWDVNLPVKVAQWLTSLWQGRRWNWPSVGWIQRQQPGDHPPSLQQGLTVISCFIALLFNWIFLADLHTHASIKNVHVCVETYTDSRIVFITLFWWANYLAWVLFLCFLPSLLTVQGMPKLLHCLKY